MNFQRLFSVLFLMAALLVSAFVISCGGDDETGSVSEAEPTAAPEADSGSVSGSVSGVDTDSGSVAEGDDIYTPASDVEQHLNVALDAHDIAALLDASPPDYAQVKQIYGDGKNSLRGDGTARSLGAFAIDAERGEEFAAEASFYGSATFLDDEITAAIDGTGVAATWSDAQRKQAINKGILRILSYWMLHEMMEAQAKTAAGDLDPAEGAPHNWDEAWAFYVGAEDDSGARPYALSGTALKRENDYNKQGIIDAPLREALVAGQEAIEEGDADAVSEAIEDVESRLNAVFYIGTARYFQKALESSAAGDNAATGVALIEGLSFYRTIQPMVAAADPGADEAIMAFYNRAADSPVTTEERDAALAALNRSAVVSSLALEVTDLLSPASYG